MHKYRSLVAWQRAHQLALDTLRATDRARNPRTRAVFDQLRRAVASVEANIVEGYALGTTPQLRRHLKIALGSAAEAECLLRTSHELDCLPADEAKNLLKTSAALLKVLYGFWRRSCSTSAP